MRSKEQKRVKARQGTRIRSGGTTHRIGRKRAKNRAHYKRAK